MSLLPFNDNLTHDAPTRQLVAGTHVGMAHFAGTGPAGETCRGCRHWQHASQWHPAAGKRHGAPKDAPCLVARRLLQTLTRPIPHDASACKFFEVAEKPQPVRRPEKVFA